jgi:hypothetical protein
MIFPSESKASRPPTPGAYSALETNLTCESSTQEIGTDGGERMPSPGLNQLDRMETRLQPTKTCANGSSGPQLGLGLPREKNVLSPLQIVRRTEFLHLPGMSEL